jgi:hypothetical protein
MLILSQGRLSTQSCLSCASEADVADFAKRPKSGHAGTSLHKPRL